MTDGTSQGLFIVVAIVIFGIFVALSYTVFGSDGLSGGLESFFTTGTEQAFKSFNEYQDVDFTISPRASNTEEKVVHSFSDNSIEYTTDGLIAHGSGVSISSDFLEFGSEYRISFDLTKVSGSIANIGGHLHISEKQDVYINGIKQTGRWVTGMEYIDNYETNHIEIYFNTDYLKLSDSGSLRGTFGTSGEQPANVTLVTNRTHRIGEREEHRAIMENIRVQKIVNR